MLIGLERDLLCQHNVANGKAPLRPEAPDGDLHIVLVEFVNVHLTTVADAIVLPAVAASHIEVPRALVLSKSDRRQPPFQQVERFLLGLPAPGRRTGEIPPHPRYCLSACAFSAVNSASLRKVITATLRVR